MLGMGTECHKKNYLYLIHPSLPLTISGSWPLPLSTDSSPKPRSSHHKLHRKRFICPPPPITTDQSPAWCNPQTPPCLLHSPIPIDCSICHTEFCSPWLLVNLHTKTLLWNAKDCRTVKEGRHDVQYVKQKDIFSCSLPCCQCTAEAQGHHPPPVANPCISFQFQLAEIMVLFYYLFYFIVKLLQRW